jgi:hypothetical protein
MTKKKEAVDLRPAAEVFVREFWGDLLYERAWVYGVEAEDIEFGRLDLMEVVRAWGRFCQEAPRNLLWRRARPRRLREIMSLARRVFIERVRKEVGEGHADFYEQWIPAAVSDLLKGDWQEP